jgi:hypothetical protein
MTTFNVGQTVKIPIEINSTVVSPIIVSVINPLGTVTPVVANLFTANGSIVDTKVYSIEIVVIYPGQWTYIIPEDISYCGCSRVGYFNAVTNILDENVGAHLAIGSVGYYLNQILGYLNVYEFSGTGSCKKNLKLPLGTYYWMYKKGESSQTVAQGLSRIPLNEVGASRDMGKIEINVDPGTYDIVTYNCMLNPSRVTTDVTISCGTSNCI